MTNLANNPQSYIHEKEMVELGKKEGLRNTYSLSSIINAVCNTAITSVASSIDTKRKKVGFKRECLSMIYLEAEKSIIKINGKKIPLEDYSKCIGELVTSFNTSNLMIEVHLDTEQKKIHFDHYGKDPENSGGKNNQVLLIPCHLVRKDEGSAEVIFENDRGILNCNNLVPRVISSDDLVFMR